jgi:hypothetical protein
MVTRGQGGQTGLEPESGLGLGEACGPRGSVVRSQVLNFLRHPHLCLNTRARDLRPEDSSHVCTFAQAAGRFALLHRGQHVVLSLP